MVCDLVKYKVIHSSQAVEIVLAFCEQLDVRSYLDLTTGPALHGDRTLWRADDSYGTTVTKVSYFVLCRRAGQQHNRIGVNGFTFLEGQ